MSLGKTISQYLAAHEINALKVVLGSMLTRHRMAETLKGARA